MMSLRVVHAGAGYQYLLRSVATNDAYAGQQSLHDYYAAKGTPQGRWRGSGLDGLQSEHAVDGQFVTAEQMSALYGEGLHPDTDEKLDNGENFDDCKLGRAFPVYTKNDELLSALAVAEKEFRLVNNKRPDDAERTAIALSVGRRFYLEEHGQAAENDRDVIDWVNVKRDDVRQAVSGFDMTFSPMKSVSVLWALADRNTASRIAAIHHEAVNDVLTSIENNALFTRSGYRGVQQVKTKGMIAAEFTHFDTRAGDPDLHSHVLVSNKVQDENGEWKSIDGKMLHHYNAACGQLYNLSLMQRLERELGVNFAPREASPGKSAVWEIEGINESLLQAWSNRRELARPIYDRLVTEFIGKHGKAPGKKATYALWQQAILETRDAKKPAESLDTLRDSWRSQARQFMPETDINNLVQTVVKEGEKARQQRSQEGTEREYFNSDVHLVSASKMAVQLAMSRRSEIFRSHLETAVNQTLHHWRFADDVQLHSARIQVIENILSTELLNLTPGEVLDLPSELRTDVGTGIDKRANSDRFTTPEHLANERRIVDASTQPQPLFVAEEEISQALDDYAEEHGFSLNHGQEALARHLLNRGTVLAVGVGPAGTGKTTSMKLVTDLWKAQGRNVIGLAPSAAAAHVLAKDITSECRTIDSLTFHWNKAIAAGYAPEDIIGTPGFEIQRGDMLLVDEAGMASTDRVATLLDIAHASGAVIRMVGDPAQLDSVDTGGIFRTLTNQPGTPQLDQVMRMRYRDESGKMVVDQEQADASLLIRDGNTEALDLHHKRGWVTAGGREEMITSAVAAYLSDTAAGKNSLLVAPTNADVTTMNEMIQSIRIDEGVVDTRRSTTLSDGLTAARGDIILARRNTFLEQKDHTAIRVLNGQTMTVECIHKDGSITARDRKTGKDIWLDDSYVADCVQLGYASTIHRCQGATVDTTHGLVDNTVDRNGLYVALTRGKQENRIYTILGERVDEQAEDAHMHSAGDRDAADAKAILDGIVLRDNSQRSALDVMKSEMTAATSTERIRNLYYEGAARATRQYAETATDRYIDSLPQIYAQALEPGSDGREAIINAVADAAKHGIGIEDYWTDVSHDIDWADEPGRLIGSRIRHVTNREVGDDTPSSSLVTPPPFIAGADPELALWLETTFDTLTESEKAEQRRRDAAAAQAEAQQAQTRHRHGQQTAYPGSARRLQGMKAVRAIREAREIDSKLRRITKAIDGAEEQLASGQDVPDGLSEQVDKAKASAASMRQRRSYLAAQLPPEFAWDTVIDNTPEVNNLGAVHNTPQRATPQATIDTHHEYDHDQGADLS